MSSGLVLRRRVQKLRWRLGRCRTIPRGRHHTLALGVVSAASDLSVPVVRRRVQFVYLQLGFEVRQLNHRPVDSVTRFVVWARYEIVVLRLAARPVMILGRRAGNLRLLQEHRSQVIDLHGL